MKACTTCHIVQELSAFGNNRNNPDGLQNRCRGCSRQQRENNKIKNINRDFSSIIELDCRKCYMTKPVAEFAPKLNSPSGFDYWCRPCRQQYSKNHRPKYGVTDEDYEERKTYQAEQRKWYHDLKSVTPCVDCGKNNESYCMDYDHVPGRGVKVRNVSRMILSNYPKEEIVAEIAKCDLVCVLCHNKRTFDRINEKYGAETVASKYVLRNLAAITEFKAHPCAICGNQYEEYNMQADHIDPTNKSSNICNLKSCKLETLMAELAKCQVLCALCHRRKSILEQRAKYSVPMQGKPHTPESKAKISAALTGRVRNPAPITKPVVIVQSSAKRRMPSDREQAIAQAYLDGKTIKEIEQTYATGRSSIYRILDRNNIQRSNNFSRWEGKSHSEDTKQQMSSARSLYWANKKETND